MRRQAEGCITHTAERRAISVRFRLILAAVLLLALSEALACLMPTRPEALAEHRTIILGEVVGVRLTDYAADRLRQIEHGASSLQGDVSPGYEVDVLAVEMLKGSASPKLTLSVPGGCSLPEAALRRFGLFYVDAKGTAIPVYQDDYEYLDRLRKLGSRYGAACANEMERSGAHPCPKPRPAFATCIALISDAADLVAPSCPGVGRKIAERLQAKE